MSDTLELITALRSKIDDANHHYWVLTSPVTPDAEYDSMLAQLIDLENKHPEHADPNSPTKRIGSYLSANFTKEKHVRKMLSLDNVFNSTEMSDFFPAGADLAIELKIDGLSVALRYVDGVLDKAITRGDGSVGEDVTENVRTIRSIPLKLPTPLTVEIRGEIYMPWTVFQRLNEEAEAAGDSLFANPRNAAAGTLRLKESAVVAKRRLSFVAHTVGSDIPPAILKHDDMLGWFEELGFISTYTLPAMESCRGRGVYVIHNDVDEIGSVVELLDEYRKYLDVATDGLVAKVNDLKTQTEMGEGTKSPKWAVAYKFAPERRATKLKSISIGIGKTGKVTPIAELEAVELSGTVVKRASLCNADEVDRLQVGEEDMVFVEKSAEIIPKVMGVMDKRSKSVWKMPTECPHCNSTLVRPEGLVDYFCQNETCPEVAYQRLLFATSKQALDIDGCGDQLVRSLTKKGILKLSDLLAASDFNFLKPAQIKKLTKGIREAKECVFWRKLMALNIEGFGKSTCQDVAIKYASIFDIVDAAESGELEKMLGPAKSKSFTNFVQSNEDEIVAVIGAGMALERGNTEASGPLTGKVFVVTGTLTTLGRDAVSELIESNGGQVKSAVSRKTDFVLVGANPGGNKTRAAAKHGVPTISEHDLYSMLGKDPSIVDNLDDTGDEPDY